MKLSRIIVPGVVLNLKPNPLPLLRLRTGSQSARVLLYERGSQYVQPNRTLKSMGISSIRTERLLESECSATDRVGFEPALQAD